MSVPRFWRELDTRYNLIGSYCKITDTYHYPRRSFNPEAGRESIGSMEDYQFKGTGTVVTPTVVHQAQTGYEMFGPYCMAIIELDEGPRITSQIVDCRPDTVKSGMRVKSVFRKLGEDSESGILHYGTKFILFGNGTDNEPDNDNIDNVELLKMNAEDLDFESSTKFDIVIGGAILHHINYQKTRGTLSMLQKT